MNTVPLYKIDSAGKTRVWWIEYDEEKYRVHSGIHGGKIVVSGWKYAESKNVGRANETTVAEQVVLEVEALVKKQVEIGKYATVVSESVDGYFEPMLADKYDPSKNKYPLASQPKLDGIRCIARADGLWSRKGKPFVSVPHIMEALKPIFAVHPNLVIDGELYNHELRRDFEKIVSLVRKTKPTEADIRECAEKVQFHVYDFCFGDATSFTARCAIGWDIVPESDIIRCVPTVYVKDDETRDGLFSEYLRDDFEGQMLRHPNSPYENKRSKFLLKRKEFDDGEFTIVDIEEGVGNWAGYAKSIVIRLEDGTTQNAGMRGSQSFAKNILDQREKLLDTQVTVRYQGRTSDGKLRFPVVTQFWFGERDV